MNTDSTFRITEEDYKRLSTNLDDGKQAAVKVLEIVPEELVPEIVARRRYEISLLGGTMVMRLSDDLMQMVQLTGPMMGLLQAVYALGAYDERMRSSPKVDVGHKLDLRHLFQRVKNGPTG